MQKQRPQLLLFPSQINQQKHFSGKIVTLAAKCSAHSCSNDNKEQVRALLKVKPSLMLGSDCNQQTPLHTAVLERKPAMLPILFPHSDVSLLDSNRQNAIHISIKMESSLDFPGPCATVFQALCPHKFLSAITEQGTFFGLQVLMLQSR